MLILIGNSAQALADWKSRTASFVSGSSAQAPPSHSSFSALTNIAELHAGAHRLRKTHLVALEPCVLLTGCNLGYTDSIMSTVAYALSWYRLFLISLNFVSLVSVYLGFIHRNCAICSEPSSLASGSCLFLFACSTIIPLHSPQDAFHWCLDCDLNAV
jgi:hypothetical protein